MGRVIWRRKGTPCPYTVWEGTKNSARGSGRRYRWTAILTAWYWSRYNELDVWVERNPPKMIGANDD